MTREERRYRVTSRAQLIDLNRESTNFRLTFECVSEGGKPFHMCVTNQEELDSKELGDLPMKEVSSGFISGNIVADSNVYQNYFIVLRSDEASECDVQVTIDLEPIAYVPPPSNDHAPTSAATTGGTHPMWQRVLFYVGIGFILCLIAFYILTLNPDRSSSSSNANAVVSTLNEGLQVSSFIDELSNAV